MAETAALAARLFVGQDGTNRATSVPNSLVGKFELVKTYDTAADHADFSLEAGKLHLVNPSVITTNRLVVTLPASGDEGEQCAIRLTADCPSTQGLEVEVTAASGDTYDGVAGGTERHVLIQEGDLLVIGCDATDATWRTDYDGRVMGSAQVYQANQITNFFAANNTFYSITYDTEDYDDANILQIANDYFEPRRPGRYKMVASVQGVALSNGSEILTRIVKDAGGTPVTVASKPEYLGVGGNGTAVATVCVDVPSGDIGTVNAQFTVQARISLGAARTLNGSANHVTSFAVDEIRSG